MKEFSFPLRVYIEDTDAQGIVYYVNYLKYMERGRAEWLRSCGFERSAFGDEGRMFVVHSLETQYLKPAKLDDQLRVTARSIKYGRAYFVVEQKVFREGELLCKGTIKVACVDQASGRPVAMSAEMIQRVFTEA